MYLAENFSNRDIYAKGEERSVYGFLTGLVPVYSTIESLLKCFVGTSKLISL